MTRKTRALATAVLTLLIVGGTAATASAGDMSWQSVPVNVLGDMSWQ
ncbi:hypothetical protein [Streptomyces sp. NPDC047974]